MSSDDYVFDNFVVYDIWNDELTTPVMETVRPPYRMRIITGLSNEEWATLDKDFKLAFVRSVANKEWATVYRLMVSVIRCCQHINGQKIVAG